MPDLLLRDIPPEVYERLRVQARLERRSMSATAINLLIVALAQEESQYRHDQALQRLITRMRVKMPLPITGQTLLREDRER